MAADRCRAGPSLDAEIAACPRGWPVAAGLAPGAPRGTPGAGGVAAPEWPARPVGCPGGRPRDQHGAGAAGVADGFPRYASWTGGGTCTTWWCPGRRGCPAPAACECCAAPDGLSVQEADTPVGVICLTLCDDCAEAGRTPRLGVPAAVRRAMAHEQHTRRVAGVAS